MKKETTYNQEFSSKREESIALQYKSVGSRHFNISSGATENLACFVKIDTIRGYTIK